MMAVISHLLKAYDPSNSPFENHPTDSALQQLRSIIRPGSLVILVSDFLHLGPECKRHLIQLRKHNDVLGIKVADPFELHTPTPALYGVQSAAGSKVLSTLSDRNQRRFEDHLQGHLSALKEHIIKAGVPLIPVQTNDPWVNTLKNGLSNPNQAFGHWLGTLS